MKAAILASLLALTQASYTVWNPTFAFGTYLTGSLTTIYELAWTQTYYAGPTPKFENHAAPQQ